MTGERTCGSYEYVEGYSAPLVPPYIYRNQCASEVLTSYLPVLLIGFSIQTFLPLMVSVMLFQKRVIRPIKFCGHQLFHGIIYLNYWQKLEITDQDGSVLSKDIIDSRKIFCLDVLNGWLVLVTFGLCSPVLTLAVACSVVLKMSLYVMFIGRFSLLMLEKHDNVKIFPQRNIEDGATISETQGAVENSNAIPLSALIALSEVEHPLLEILSLSYWRILFYSGLFVAFLTWDIAMDEAGWLHSLWVPFLPAVFFIIVRFFSFYLQSTKGLADTPRITELHDRSSTLTSNPLHQGE